MGKGIYLGNSPRLEKEPKCQETEQEVGVVRKARDKQIGIPAPPLLSCVTQGKLISSFED